jgi:hypothetical protein
MYVQLWLITVLGNCGCVAVARFLRVPSPLLTEIAPVLVRERERERLVEEIDYKRDNFDATEYNHYKVGFRRQRGL